MTNNIIIWGAGSRGRILLNMSNYFFYKKKKINSKNFVFVDQKNIKIKKFLTISDKKNFQKISKKIKYFIVSIGSDYGKARALISEHLIKKKKLPLSMIHGSFIIDKSSKIGIGVQIMPNVVVNSTSVIGDFSILNTSCTIEHDCVIGKGVNVMGSSYISGNVKIKDYVTIGANSVILPNLTIEEGAVIGAGSVVTKNVKKHEIVFGNPAKFYSRHKPKLDLSFF